jgi:hypothetical protein
MARAALHRQMVEGSADGPTQLASRGGARAQMAGALRTAVFAAAALLWLSGVLWLVLHYALAQAGPFGALPNPWEAVVMRVHGVLAVGGVFVLGWITAGHVAERWPGARKRRSGLTLGASAAVLVLSGYALYYTTGSPHEASALVHEVLGVCALFVALAHWWRRRVPR